MSMEGKILGEEKCFELEWRSKSGADDETGEVR